jgi:murein L,D-transpeptidase YcbB/YkuD
MASRMSRVGGCALAAGLVAVVTLGVARADEIGLDGPAVAPLDRAIFKADDLRAEPAPMFSIAPDALDAAVIRASDLGVEAAPAPPAAPLRRLSGPLVDPLVISALSPRGAPPPFVIPSEPQPPRFVAEARATAAFDDAPAAVAPPSVAAAPVAAENTVVAKADASAPIVENAPVAPSSSSAAPAGLAADPAGMAADPAPSAAIRAALDARLADPSLRGRIGHALRQAREEMARVYAARGDQPLWIAGSHWTAAAHGAFERLRRADEDGLDLGATRIAALGDPSAEGELHLSEAVVAYARQASGGRVEPWRIAALISAKPETATPAEALARVAGAVGEQAAGQVLRDFNPPHPGYVALRDKLAEIRREKPKQVQEPIPLGPTLKVGMRDARVPLIRSRLGLGPNDAPAAPDETLVYDTRVASAVKDFQRDNGLPASGHLTPRTVAALSGGEPSQLENEVLANMERWRWLPRDLGAERIEVNIPDYALALKEGERTTLTARVVVGKPDSPTPVFSDRMRFLVVNPSWTMPPSILEKEALPNLASDPDYYARRGYEVTWRNGKVSVRQPPGERNALGHIKFMFPNDHAVYLHDTPSRALFQRDRRAFSHGCVRVDQPFSLAEAVLGGRFSEAALKKMVGPRERTIALSEPLPIHLTYFTAKVEADGRLVLSDDIYGYSRRLRGAMGLEGAAALAATSETRGERSVSGETSRALSRALARRARTREAVDATDATTRVAQPTPAAERRSGFFGWARGASSPAPRRDFGMSER